MKFASIGVLASAMLCGIASAQPTQPPATGGNPTRSATPAAPPVPPLVERLFKRGKTKHWSLIVNLYYPGQRFEAAWGRSMYDSYVQQDLFFMDPRHQKEAQARSGTAPGQTTSFKAAELVFPLPRASAGHESQDGTFEWSMFYDGTEDNSGITFSTIDNLPCGARLGKWHIARDVTAVQLRLEIRQPMSCWELAIDPVVAASIEWPKTDWPAEAKTALGPQYLVDYKTNKNEIDTNKKAVEELITRWLGKRDLRTIKPVELAKMLAGRTLDFFSIAHPGIVGDFGSNFYGYDLMTTDAILRDRRGSEEDAATLLCSIYRVAGLPARTVFGFDMSRDPDKNPKAKKKKNSEMIAWVEFAVLDPKDNSVVWIPVDINKQRRNGNRAPALDRPWDYFGNNEDLTYVLPIAFHAHPPANYCIRGFPAFWGWMALAPDGTLGVPPAQHSLRISASTQNSEERKKNLPKR